MKIRNNLTVLAALLELCLAPSALAQVPILGSTGTFTTSINGTYFVGAGAYSTIQAAITAAGTTGSVTILPNYGGTDLFTNPNSIRVADLRLMSNTSSAVRDVYASDFGAKCNGTANDTAGIQAALNAQYAFSIPAGSTRVAISVHLPQGTCMITAPLAVGIYGQLVGEGASTFLVGNYFSWVGTDYTMVEISYNGTLPGGSTAVTRTFGNFNVLGINSSTIATATAFSVINTANVYDPSGHALGQISFEHIDVNNMDTAFELQDIVNFQFHFVWVAQVRVAWDLNGDAIQGFFDHVYAQVGSWAGTSNHATTVGLLVQPNNKYGAGCASHSLYCAPQGIFFHDSSIVAFDRNIDIEQCVQCDIHDNTLDLSASGASGSGAGIYLGTYALGGGLWIHHNYIGTTKANTYLIYSTASTSGSGIDGLWITDNHFLDYSSPGTTIGIAFVGSVPLRQVHIDNNNFYQLNVAIASQQSLLYSTVRGNSGSTISAYLINLVNSGTPDYSGTTIESNTDSDSIPVINEGAATGFFTGYNRSPAQVLGTFTATGTGCTYAAGFVGSSCSVSMTIATPFITTNYTVTGCSVLGSSTHNYISAVGPFTVGGTFPVAETASDTTATGGGTISCTVTLH